MRTPYNWEFTVSSLSSSSSSSSSSKDEIHQRLQRAYGSVCMGASSVRRWVKHFKDGNTSIKDEPRSGSPRTASTERNKERVDEIIQDDRCVTVDPIARKLGIGHSAVQEMIESLGYKKVCARWVPR
jgi:transposase